MANLLTIIVPTFNRERSLERLLATLRVELRGLEDTVDVIVGDNASPDNTPSIAFNFARDWSKTTLIRHNTNLGPDENFCQCLERVKSDYFWIIGDDDLPKKGAIRALVGLLRQHSPDLVYLCNEWSESLPEAAQQENILSLGFAKLNQLSFARRVHIWTTFISALIVRRSLAPDSELRRYSRTNLVQLGWVLRALKYGRSFIYVQTPCVLATAGNTGGYSLLKVFGNNFQEITRNIFSDNRQEKILAETIINRASIAFLPGLVLGFRRGTLGKFEAQDKVYEALAPQLGRSLIFRIFVLPIERLPLVAARALVYLSRLLAKLISASDTLRLKLGK